MTAQDPNTWEKLYNGIATNEKNRPGGEEVLKKLDELHAVAQHGSTEDFQQHVTDLLRTYGENYGLGENTNGQDILREALAWRDTNFPTNELAKQEQQPQQSPQAPGAFSGLGKMFGEHKETPIAGQMGDITPSLQTLQEEQLLQEFDDAVAQGDETKIGQLLSENNAKLKLEGENGLLRQQLELSLKNLEQLDPEQLKKYRLNREGIAKVTQQIQNQAKKRDTILKNEKAHIPSTPAEIEIDRRRQEEKAKAEAHAAALRMDAQKADTTEKKRAAYQALIRHQIAQTNRYPSLFEEIYEEGSHDQLLGLQRVLLARAEAIQNAYRRQMFARIQTVQEEQNQQAQQRQQPNGVQKILQKTGRKEFGNLAKQGFKDIGKGFGQAGKKAISAAVKKGFSAAMKFLFASPPYIGWWIVGILLALLIIVAVIIIIIAIIQNNQSGGQNAPTPTPVVGSAVPQGSCSGVGCKDKLAALGVFTSGAQGLNGDPYGRVRLLYDTLSKVLQPPSLYGTLLGLPKKSISVDFANGGCAGHADHSGFLFLYGFGNCGRDVAEFMVIHELSHVIAFRNPSLYNKFLNSVPAFNLPTFNCQLDYVRLKWKPPYPGECFADSIGEYVLYKTYRNTVSGLPHYYTGRSFPNYSTSFSSYYNFAGKYIFNGLTF